MLCSTTPSLLCIDFYVYFPKTAQSTVLKTLYNVPQFSKCCPKKYYALCPVTSVRRQSRDARLFCKNKQVNLKNKPKIGNLTEKQAQHALAGKLKKTKISKKIFK